MKLFYLPIQIETFSFKIYSINLIKATEKFSKQLEIISLDCVQFSEINPSTANI